MKTKKIIIPVSTPSEFYDKTADYAVIELSTQDISRIKHLAEAVKNLQVYKVAEFNYLCNFMVNDYEADSWQVAMKEFEGQMECNTLNVTDSGCYWSGLYKHTDVRWSTETVPLTALDEPGDYDLRKESE